MVIDTAKRDALLALLRAQIGTPYVWGGNEPGKFDCSGLIQWVYGKFGITTGRTTWDQIRNGEPVATDSMVPGDLVFFDTDDVGVPDDPTHVGVYVGDGKMVHSPRPGDTVREVTMSGNSYWTSRIVGARRLFDVSSDGGGNGTPPSGITAVIPSPLGNIPVNIPSPFGGLENIDWPETGKRLLIGGLGIVAIVIGLTALLREPMIEAATVVSKVAK